AVPGDNIVITKPIGTGIITTAFKGGKIRDVELQEAVSWMLRSNKEASILAINSGVHSGTDITGFGLLGHAFNMVRNQEVDFAIDHKAVPIMEKAVDLADFGIIPEGAYENLKHLKTSQAVETNLDDDTLLLLTDPQTSGGLILTFDDSGLETYARYAEFFAVIGKVQRGTGKLQVI
ncbi:MAG: selenide, water dikinase SelD, partial [Nitrospirae bacterium]